MFLSCFLGGPRGPNVAGIGEEARGPRTKNPAEPGRTYECEIWCRDASRQFAGCVGFTCLILTYAVSK